MRVVSKVGPASPRPFLLRSSMLKYEVVFGTGCWVSLRQAHILFQAIPLLSLTSVRALSWWTQSLLPMLLVLSFCMAYKVFYSELAMSSSSPDFIPMIATGLTLSIMCMIEAFIFTSPELIKWVVGVVVRFGVQARCGEPGGLAEGSKITALWVVCESLLSSWLGGERTRTCFSDHISRSRKVRSLLVIFIHSCSYTCSLHVTIFTPITLECILGPFHILVTKPIRKVCVIRSSVWAGDSPCLVALRKHSILSLLTNIDFNMDFIGSDCAISLWPHSVLWI